MMLNYPSISIIIATYNDATTLPLAIQSILAQNAIGVEIIVIDGASSDGTSQLLKSYGKKISAWISEPDKGIYDAWNKGLELAQGEWIAFLGSDDILCPMAIHKYRRFIKCNPGLNYISSRVRLKCTDGSMRIIGGAWHWSIFRRHMNVAHVGSLHRRALFRMYGNFDSRLKVCGDYDFLLRVGEQLRSGFVNQVLVEMSAGGVSNSSPFVILETMLVKLRSGSVGYLQAFFDFAESLFKWSFRYFGRSIKSMFINVYVR